MKKEKGWLQQAILEFVQKNPGSTVADASEVIDTTPGSVDASVRILVNKRLIQRVQSAPGGAKGRAPYKLYPFGYDATQSVSTPAAVLPVAHPAPAPLTIERTIQEFVSALVSQVTTQVTAQLHATLQAQVDDAIAKAVKSVVIPAPEKGIAAGPTAPAPRKRRVLIVGLLPQQAGMIQQEFHRELDLSFYQTTEHRNRLASAAGHADIVISMTKFIDHSVTETIKAAKANLRYCNGGLTALRDILTEEYAHHG